MKLQSSSEIRDQSRTSNSGPDYNDEVSSDLGKGDGAVGGRESDSNVLCSAHGWNLRRMSFLHAHIILQGRVARWARPGISLGLLAIPSKVAWGCASHTHWTGIWESETEFLSKYLSAALRLEASLNSQQIPDPASAFPKSCGCQNHSSLIVMQYPLSVYIFSIVRWR